MSTQETDRSGEQFESTIDTESLEVALDALGAAAEESVWNIGDDGLTARAVDPARVLMCRVIAPTSAFESYTPAPITLGVRLPAMRDAATAGDETSIGWDAETHKITVESGPVDAELGSLDASTIRDETISQDVLDNANAAWTMPYDAFNDAVTIMSRFGGEVVQIHASPDFHGMRKHGDVNDVTVDFDDYDDVEWVDEPENGNVVLQAEGYMKETRRAMPNDATVTVYAGDDYPTVTQYDHGDIEVTFVQAPRIKN